MSTEASTTSAQNRMHVSKRRHAAEIAGALALAVVAGVGVMGSPSSPLSPTTAAVAHHVVADDSAPDVTVAPCAWYVTGHDIPAYTSHGACVTPTGALLTACTHEDSDNCFWDASASGNRVGRSFFTVHGVTTYSR